MCLQQWRTFADDIGMSNAEVIWLQIQLPKSKNFLVGYVYRPPKTKAATDKVIEKNIENVISFGTDVYILGDVNMDLLKNTDYPMYIH